MTDTFFFQKMPQITLNWTEIVFFLNKLELSFHINESNLSSSNKELDKKFDNLSTGGIFHQTYAHIFLI